MNINRYGDYSEKPSGGSWADFDKNEVQSLEQNQKEAEARATEKEKSIDSFKKSNEEANKIMEELSELINADEQDMEKINKYADQLESVLGKADESNEIVKDDNYTQFRMQNVRPF